MERLSQISKPRTLATTSVNGMMEDSFYSGDSQKLGAVRLSSDPVILERSRPVSFCLRLACFLPGKMWHAAGCWQTGTNGRTGCQMTRCLGYAFLVCCFCCFNSPFLFACFLGEMHVNLQQLACGHFFWRPKWREVAHPCRVFATHRLQQCSSEPRGPSTVLICLNLQEVSRR